ncbi:MAG: hypothetical protein J0I09_07305 [Sphingobacteriia bacterium]|nr:hypothetical protein [Sphingobacteriia bacterium]
MKKNSLLRNVFAQHKVRLLITYSLFSLEMLGSLMRPFFLGKAVDDLVDGSYKGLIILSLVHFSWIIIGTIRHRYDTRTYSSIYTSLVTNFLSKRLSSEAVSKLSAHSTLAREFVDFLEYDLVYVIEAIYNILGSLVLLYFYDKQVVLICLGVLLPVSAMSYFYGKKMKHLNKKKNDELEKQVDVISSGNELKIRSHYNNLKKWQIKISDQEAWNFGWLEMLVMVVIAAALFVTKKNISSEGIYAGELIGIYNYILKFVGGLDTIPYTVQRLTSLNDITKRIESEEEFDDDTPAVAV